MDVEQAARGALTFLASYWGQLLLAALSVFVLVMFKSFTRRPGDRQNKAKLVQIDDLAVGLDLLVLAIITVVGYAVLQSSAEHRARERLDFRGVDEAQDHQVNALWLAFALVFVLIFVIFMVLHAGQYSREERVEWKIAELARLKTTQPTAEMKDINDPPRFRPVFGVVVPGLIGLIMLSIAIRLVVQQ